MTPQPQYQRLAQELIDQIATGRYAVGDRLPTEAELCHQHQLSRGTVRMALDRLVQLELIERRPRVGSTVISAGPRSMYRPFVADRNEIVELAQQTRIIRPITDEIVVDEALAHQMRCSAGSAWFRIRGPRILTDQVGPPLCFSEHFLRANRPPAERQALITGSFGASPIRHHRIEQEIHAELLPAELAPILECDPGGAALVIHRRHFVSDELISVSFHTHPGSRYWMSSELPPENEQASATPKDLP